MEATGVGALPASGSRALSSLADLDQFARDFLSGLPNNAVVFLTGDLGAGKTEFVKRLLAAMGVRDVSSPTFALGTEYVVTGDASTFERVWHFDLYRLENMDEIETSGLWEALDQPGLVLVEWANRISEADIPPTRALWSLHFTVSDTTRSVTW